MEAVSLDASTARSLIELVWTAIISLWNRHWPVKIHLFLDDLVRSHCGLEGCWLFSGKDYACHEGSTEGHELFHLNYYNNGR
jgi:hypothetical protein